MNPSRMEVGAALQRIVDREGDLEEASRIVITYALTLKERSGPRIEWTSKKRSGGSSISGYSPGQGETRIEDREHTEFKEAAYGIHKDRIGHYRLWRDGPGMIAFHHFWKSNVSTQGGSRLPDEYCICYDTRTLQFESTSVERVRSTEHRFLSLVVSISTGYYERIAGTGAVPHSTRGFGIHWHRR